MQIETLNTLLQTKRPGARAYVPANVRGSRRTIVSIVYAPGGKVYEYRGHIYEVAERLQLIADSKDINAAAERIARALKTAESVIDFAGAADTLRWRGCDVETTDATDDEYGRKRQMYREAR